MSATLRFEKSELRVDLPRFGLEWLLGKLAEQNRRMAGVSGKAPRTIQVCAIWINKMNTHFGGDLWSRPRLIGDWLGIRDEMARCGVTIDLDLSQILQGVGSGGRKTDVGYWGLVD